MVPAVVLRVWPYLCGEKVSIICYYQFNVSVKYSGNLSMNIVVRASALGHPFFNINIVVM